MECFNDLLLKLREVHDREVEGWQVKVQELSNKKGCDTKRMEELFTRNQQMKEQQRLLTENIKTLENRLRAGLCDRCTVTQEVAKKRQKEFEASQIQTLQHISIMAGEMNNLKKENKRLRDEIRNLKAALDRGHSDQSSNSSITTEIKANSSPDLSPSSVSVGLNNTATSRASHQPSDGDVAVKAEADQRAEETEPRYVRAMNKSQFESFKPLLLSSLVSPSWKTEHSIRDRRLRSVEALDQRTSVPPHPLLLKNVSSAAGGEVNHSRHVLHAPVPCRPQPIKSSPVAVPWPLSESCDWVSAAAASTGLLVQSSSKKTPSQFPSIIPTNQHTSPSRQVFGSPWHNQSTPHPIVKEPTVVFRVRNVHEHVESQPKPQEKKEILSSKSEKISEGLRETYEGPLDLSDRGKSKSDQAPSDSALALQEGERAQKSPERDVKANPSAHVPVSSPSPVAPSSCSSPPPVKEEEPISDLNHKQVIKEQEEKEELNGMTSQSNDKKVPVLTISLRPVVLETLNSARQKQDSLSSNGKASSPAVELRSSSDEQEKESMSRQESTQSCKRKRASDETEPDRDSDTHPGFRGNLVSNPG
ncbi:DNA endonuclease RBBP8 isoform X3 [Mastacembelus armatus]|uniref:DNA endonuclease RBBP8 isoform X3 n=1 Tax=Mastacembelus armatus TaxID=205130 RepID=UPI000E45DBC3|nr:DNA endonuclease RBBP8-like isoform X3 [Mastacembelus armatus]